MIASALALVCGLGVIAIALYLTARPEVVNFSFAGRTDSFSMNTIDQPARPYVIRVPSATLIFEDPEQDFELVSRPLLGAASLVIEGNGLVDISSEGAGLVSIRAEVFESSAGQRAEPSELRIYDETGLVHSSIDTLDLSINCLSDACSRGSSIVFLLHARTATVGRSLLEWIEPVSQGQVSFQQLKLEGGLIEAHLPAQVYGTRFKLDETRLEPGDVLELKGVDPVVGTVSIDLTSTDRGRIEVVAYTRGESLDVQRFGGGYTFGVPKFTALSQQPFAQILWLTLVSLLIVVSAWATLTELISGFRTNPAATPNPSNTRNADTKTGEDANDET